MNESLKTFGLFANGGIQHRAEGQRLFCVVGSECESHSADGVQAILGDRPLPHGLGDGEDGRAAAATFHACRHRRRHEVIHGFAHGPEQKAGADAAAQRHGDPVPGLVIRGGIRAADLNAADLGEGKYKSEDYGDNGKQAEEPAKAVRHAIEDRGQQGAKSLCLKNAEADQNRKQSQRRPQR